MASSNSNGYVIACHTVEDWEGQLRRGIENNNLIVEDFTASWCGPCRTIAPFFSDLAKKLPHVIFLKVDVDELSTVAKQWSIEAMPTFIVLKEGKALDTIVGAKKEELQRAIEKHLNALM